ncbi:MAG: replicative DNA helicase [Pyrinomonadaceae bacterium]|nr:replicative DNA helicase [Pyrinomonadaceae bacterium]
MAQYTDYKREQFLERPLPSSEESERVILGAILLDNALLSQAIEELKPDDFYSPLHRKIYKAMLALFDASKRIDPILIGEELKKDGALESIGGIATITNLTYGLPHFSDLQEYTKVVRSKSVVRNLIKVCNQITSEALAEEDDAEVILDNAESMIFALADERTRQGFSHIQPIAETVLAKVQEYAKRESHALTGLSTGFRDFDEKTSGLQKTDLIIVAARPSMGKTALCLTIAQNAAILEKAVVAVFSLEMSKEQLVMRMLSSEAKVDAHRFRTGYLTRDEWGRLAQAIGTLSESKVFIDDTPGISVMEMRAKTRRLVAEQKRLDLIVVDYLQLMSGGKRSESRQQEVSQISRELKALAKELQVPVVALSQLSRAPEARNPPKPMMSDLRESGCLASESLITLADTGEEIPIKDLVGKKGFRVWALNEQNWGLVKAEVTNAFSTGIKLVFKLKTRLGREIRATANHKFFGFPGWKRLDEFKIGDRIALPREIRNENEQTMTDAEIALLAHLIGDGCTLPRHSIQYTTREKDLAETVANLAIEVFGDEVLPKIKQERTWFQVYLSSTRRHTHNVRSAVAEWLDELGIWGLRSHEKFVPSKIFTQPTEAVALFLRHLWATDGCIWVNEKSNHHPGIYYASSSRKLAEDVQNLLLRIGINARLREISQGAKGMMQYHVIVSGKSDIEKFIETIKAVGAYKNQSLEKVKNFISRTSANSNRDSIPNEVWQKYVVPAMKTNGMTTRQMFERISTRYCGTRIYKQNISRNRALRIAKAINSDDLLKLSLSDVYWDEIISITPDGETEVFDLTVKDYANFVSKGFIAHNSIEQDADVVMFIYREEYYKPSEENAGVADILISKQRNGPTGTVRLAFLKEFTRFENYYGDYQSDGGE